MRQREPSRAGRRSAYDSGEAGQRPAIHVVARFESTRRIQLDALLVYKIPLVRTPATRMDDFDD
jgi:hypothetical protein